MRSCYLLVACVAALLLSGCATPARIGVSQQSWQNMNDAQQKQLKDSYAKVRSWRRNRDNGKPDGSKINITIVGGTAQMPPSFDRYHFQPLHITIASGKCSDAEVISHDSDHSTQLDFCYSNSILSIDPSHHEWKKRDGTLLLQKNPMWQHGLVYHGKSINSTGYVSFNNISIRIKESVFK